MHNCKTLKTVASVELGCQAPRSTPEDIKLGRARGGNKHCHSHLARALHKRPIRSSSLDANALCRRCRTEEWADIVEIWEEQVVHIAGNALIMPAIGHAPPPPPTFGLLASMGTQTPATHVSSISPKSQKKKFNLWQVFPFTDHVLK